MASGTKQGTVPYNSSSYEYWLGYSSVPDTANNLSKVTVWHYWKKTGSKYFDSVGERDYGITINGKTDSGAKRMDYSPWADKNISSYTVDVPHNEDGTKTITISTWANGTAGSNGPSSSTADSGDCKASATITLDAIPRKASITSAENFTDEDNPSITYTNSAGSAVTSLQACITDQNGATQYAPYRDIPITADGEYTFTLTDAERKALRTATKNVKETTPINVRFYVKTVIGDYVGHSYLTRNFNVINSSPTMSPTVEDTNEVTKALTGNPNKLIKYYSNAKFTVNPVSKKESTITSIYVANGTQSSSASTGTFNGVTSDTFKFSVTDSRANNIQQSIVKEWVEYVKLTCNIENQRPDLDGDMTVKAVGNYFNGKFSDTISNSLTVQYRYKVQGAAWLNTEDEWHDMATNMTDTSKYAATASLTGLDYKATYTFQIRAKDLLNTNGVYSAEKNVKATTIFDWGENDFNVNGELNINKKSILEYMYPVGYVYVSTVLKNPKDLFNFGTWERISDGFLWATPLDTCMATGGSKITDATTLTAAQSGVPAHAHPASFAGISHSMQARCGGTAATGATIDPVKNMTIAENTGDTWGSTYSFATKSHKTDVLSWTDGGTVTVSDSTAKNATQGHTHTFMPPYYTVFAWRRTA